MKLITKYICIWHFFENLTMFYCSVKKDVTQKRILNAMATLYAVDNPLLTDLA